MTRRLAILGSLLLWAVLVFAQQPPAEQQPDQSAQQNAPQMIIMGCLSVSNGTYTLTSTAGEVYAIDPNGVSLHRYVKKEVRVVGTISQPKSAAPSSPGANAAPVVKVLNINKVKTKCH